MKKIQRNQKASSILREVEKQDLEKVSGGGTIIIVVGNPLPTPPHEGCPTCGISSGPRPVLQQ